MKGLLIFCLMMPLVCLAQFTDDFSDGDFTNDPVWSGDSDKFTINTTGELQLYTENIAGEAYLSTKSHSINDASWEFLIKMNFNPSSNNFCNVYLISNSSDLNLITSGYFVKIGNSQDEVSLYRKDISGETKIIDGKDKRLDMNSINLRIKVNRDNDGNWALMSDTLGGTGYYLEGTAFDNTYYISAYFGIYCKYTQTNSQKFYFDDFIVAGNSYIDNTAPEVLGISSYSLNEINVSFSEPTNIETSLDVNNYFLRPGFGNPIEAYVNPENSNSVLIKFSNTFDTNQTYLLDIKNIKDLSNNTLLDKTLSLTFTKEYDVLISEIMIKPEPTVLLPNTKYIEIYNRSSYNIDISSWTLSHGATAPKKIPSYILPKGSYVVICDAESVNLFPFLENVIGIPGFPSLNITNGVLTLRDNNHKVIHTVSYSNTWYKNAFKKEGGYSLEMIDLNNPCEGIENWTASNDITGGTPGRINSVHDINPDITIPYPYAAEIVIPDTLIVYFNENLSPEYTKDMNNFSVKELGNPIWLSVREPDFSVITMRFPSHFKRGHVYYLDILDSIRDCSNNTIQKNCSIRFAIPDSITKNDIVINEILFNPYTGGKDFVELYNRSDKVLDLKRLWLSNRNANGDPDNSSQIAPISRLLLPKEYCAVSTDIQDLKNNYTIFYPENLYESITLPKMPNDYGTIILTDRHINVIDEISYDKNQHFKLLATDKGVSLERINYNRSSIDLSNWHSASQSAGFATPGYENSQYTPEISTESTITLTPKAFSPDNDGFDDRLTISYKLNEPGYVATMSVYSSNGSFITHIINNEMLGTEGNFFWDGLDDRNTLCSMGIYVLYVEMFNLDGKKIIEKHIIVLSNKR